MGRSHIILHGLQCLLSKWSKWFFDHFWGFYICVVFFLTNLFILYTFSRIIPLLLFFWDVSHDERSEVPFALRKYSISRIVQFTAWEIMLCDCLPAEHSCRFFSLDFMHYWRDTVDNLKMYKKKVCLYLKETEDS